LDDSNLWLTLTNTWLRAIEDEHGYLEQIRKALKGSDPAVLPSASQESDSNKDATSSSPDSSSKPSQSQTDNNKNTAETATNENDDKANSSTKTASETAKNVNDAKSSSDKSATDSPSDSDDEPDQMKKKVWVQGAGGELCIEGSLPSFEIVNGQWCYLVFLVWLFFFERRK